MYIGNRWVPMALANTLLVVTLLIILVIFGTLYWLSRSDPSAKKARNIKQQVPNTKKHSARKKR